MTRHRTCACAEGRGGRGAALPGPAQSPFLTQCVQRGHYLHACWIARGVRGDVCLLCPLLSLRVGVMYIDPVSGSPKELQKFYKFAVLDPVKFNYRTVFLPVRGCGCAVSRPPWLLRA